MVKEDMQEVGAKEHEMFDQSVWLILMGKTKEEEM